MIFAENIQGYDYFKEKFEKVTEVSSFKELCEILGEPVRSGENKENWIKYELNKYITYDKEGRRFTNIKIKPLKDYLISEFDELFRDKLTYLFFAMLCRYYSYSQNCYFYISSSDLYKGLGLYNSNYILLNLFFLENDKIAQIPKKIDNEILKINRRTHPKYNEIKKHIKKSRNKAIDDFGEALKDIINSSFLYEDRDDLDEEEQEIKDYLQKRMQQVFKDLENKMLNLENLTEENKYILSSPECWKIYTYFFNNVPKRLRRKLNKMLDTLEQNELINITKIKMGLTKTVINEGTENEKIIFEKHMLNDEEHKQYIEIIHEALKDFYGEEYMLMLMNDEININSPQIQKAIHEKVQEQMKLENIYEIREFFFNPIVMKEFKEVFKKKFINSLNSKGLRELIKSNSEELKTNIIDRKATKWNDDILNTYFKFLTDFVLGDLPEDLKPYSYMYSKDYDYLPKSWGKIFYKSQMYLEEEDRLTMAKNPIKPVDEDILEKMFDPINHEDFYLT